MRRNAWCAPALGVAIAVALAGPAEAAKVTIRLATETAQPDPTWELANKFRELAEAKGKGDIEVKFFPGGALGTQRQLQEQVQLGSLEIIGTASDMPELEPKFGVFDFPFLFADRRHVYKVIDGGIGEELNQTVIRNRGVRVLSWGELGFRHFTNAVRPITKPEDLKGLKIRVPPNKIRVAAIKAMGAAATPIPWKELYTALQQRVVDGQENPTNAIVSLSMWEVQKFVSLSNHVFTPTYLLINERFYQGLPAPVRRAVTQAAAEAQSWQRAENQRREGSELQQAKARGMQVNSAEIAAFLPLAQPVWDEFSAAVGKELLDRIVALRQ
ncbi:MAG: TRAP transporter substrate-binding protein [Candidatus Rokuibacteriota bacterium]